MMAGCIRRISQEVLGEPKVRCSKEKSWWLTNNVQAILKAKEECFRNWQKSLNEEYFKSYKEVGK